MFGIQDISINFLTDSLLFIIPALLILIGLSVLLYMKTNPPLPFFLRVILTILRLIAVAVLIISLLEPVISYTREFERQPKIALLLDESLSMDKTEQEKSRRSRRDSLLSSKDFDQFQKNVDLTTYHFADELSENINELKRNMTSLGNVIKQLETIEFGNYSDYWLLLSDGNSNSGSDPKKVSANLKTPILTVDLALDGGNFDIGISDIEFNPVMFAGQTAEISIKLHWQNADDNSLTIQLKDSAKVITQSNYKINQSEGLADITLKYIPQTPGQKILKINIPPISNEENKDNNLKSFSVKVLKSRLSILLVCESPDYEVGFLNRFFDQSDKYEVDLKVTGTKAGNLSSRFPASQTELNRYDLVILYDPDVNKLTSQKNIIDSYLSDKGGALWVLMGNQFSKTTAKNNWLNKFLPFYPTHSGKIEYLSFHGIPSEGNLFHPAIRLGDNQTNIRKIWSELPPFQSLIRCDNTVSEATVLLYTPRSAVGENNIPIMGYKRHGAGKIFAVSALPIWSWGFINLGFGEDDSNYPRFIESVSSWLTVSDDLEPLRIIPKKRIYHRGEVINFEGFAYDLGYRPIPDVIGSVTLEEVQTGETLETDLVSIKDGILSADFYNINPGEYKYNGQLTKDNRLLKEVEGEILVETFSLEEFDKTGNPQNLLAIAKNSGGRYFRASEFSEALKVIDIKPILVNQKYEFKIWNKFWLLLIFIACLAVEWLLRKVNQLI